MERFEEAKRWAAQSLRDLKAAEDSFRFKNYEWSCFQSQQAAEKAVKALLYVYGRSSWGHSITELLDYVRDLERVDEELYIAGRELDRHYIPSRYPNAFDSGYPGMYYDEVTAMKALESARRIINWVRECLKKTGLEI
ncbi:MAG: HEPN domain-containing protein [Thaumarchaeota archaeon]|nr:HEPN domain-containing protein [Candidatus Geocrenenecus arthurdayi]MCL7388838.1 HEPN domain-containing protein [Candidatus Geocrenenecus arthurdayi]MCL7391384.1 HEPN domain-containing protein [Candidatus Geocrenenecus arthurdayi]MCL7396762.1 HEPN domain-containing protein [Candidatus Geocrenenecus arthurdayi]MCL7403899.1 HEPN domain-containing protein [Candidatus Geocrenenecus arthurdayi]